MKTFIIFGSLLLSVTTAFAQSEAEIEVPTGLTVKASISRPMGKIFESGAVLCVPDLTSSKSKYDYGYSFKLAPELEVVEFQVTSDTDGPKGIIALREDNNNKEAGALRIDSNEASGKDVKFSGASLDFAMSDDFVISLQPVATVSGTLSLATMKLNIHVVGSFAQDVEMDCATLK